MRFAGRVKKLINLCLGAEHPRTTEWRKEKMKKRKKILKMAMKVIFISFSFFNTTVNNTIIVLSIYKKGKNKN